MRYARPKRGLMHKVTGDRTHCGKPVGQMIPVDAAQWQRAYAAGRFCWQCYVSKKPADPDP